MYVAVALSSGPEGAPAERAADQGTRTSQPAATLQQCLLAALHPRKRPTAHVAATNPHARKGTKSSMLPNNTPGTCMAIYYHGRALVADTRMAARRPLQSCSSSERLKDAAATLARAPRVPERAASQEHGSIHGRHSS
jgi:hypothetical protein